MIWYGTRCTRPLPRHCRCTRCQIARSHTDSKKNVKHIPEPRLSKGFHTVFHKACESILRNSKRFFLFFDLDRYIRHHLPLPFAVVSPSSFYFLLVGHQQYPPALWYKVLSEPYLQKFGAKGRFIPRERARERDEAKPAVVYFSQQQTCGGWLKVGNTYLEIADTAKTSWCERCCRYRWRWWRGPRWAPSSTGSTTNAMGGERGKTCTAIVGSIRTVRRVCGESSQGFRNMKWPSILRNATFVLL